MKAGTVVEKAVCESCGADVREASSFCYNCGESVSSTPEPVLSAAPAPTVSSNGLAAEKAPSSDIGLPVTSEEPIEDKTLTEEKTNLRSAASVRRRAKAYNRKPVEIVWVERQRSSLAFIVVSIVLVAFAAILLAFAMYLK